MIYRNRNVELLCSFWSNFLCQWRIAGTWGFNQACVCWRTRISDILVCHGAVCCCSPCVQTWYIVSVLCGSQGHFKHVLVGQVSTAQFDQVCGSNGIFAAEFVQENLPASRSGRSEVSKEYVCLCSGEPFGARGTTGWQTVDAATGWEGHLKTTRFCHCRVLLG